MTHRSIRDPLKWTKYLILTQFGFLTRKELEQDIRRYRRSEEDSVVRDIASGLKTDQEARRRNLYVIKLVAPGLPGRLPNFRVESLADLKRLDGYFAQHRLGDFTEIWFCRTQIDENVFSVAGRFVFTHNDSDHDQSVEQVWRCSPRLLEELSQDSRHCYLRASRYTWGWPYSIEDIRIPNGLDITRPMMVEEFHRSMKLFERERELIERFLVFLDSFGYRAYSLEYKIVGTKLTIIDWDTPDDTQIVADRSV